MTFRFTAGRLPTLQHELQGGCIEHESDARLRNKLNATVSAALAWRLLKSVCLKAPCSTRSRSTGMLHSNMLVHVGEEERQEVIAGRHAASYAECHIL